LNPDALRYLAEHGKAPAAGSAATALGILYSTGNTVPQDFAEARKWFQIAYDHGNAAGAFFIGLSYEGGKAQPRDPVEAVKWFRIAADLNYPMAKLSLSVMYRVGDGVARDDAEAIRLLRAAAVDGLPLAQGILGSLYLEGVVVPSDDSLAYEWESLAASKMPGVTVVTQKRDFAAAGLSPAEIAAAQAATTAWKPGSDLVSLFTAGSPPHPPRLRGIGSGFIIGKAGEIATDFHVVPNCREIKLIDPAGKYHTDTHLIAQDKDNDVAILAGGGFGTRLKLRTVPAEVGEDIHAYGFPLGPMLSSGGNLTAGSVSAAAGMGNNAKTFQITAPVQVGSSGGPVVDEGGAVIGVVAAKLNALNVAAATGDLAQNVNFAWRTGPLKALMDQQAIAYETVSKPAPHSGTDLAGLLQKATVKIECWR
jgi:S1-C subfamily serine protease